MEVNAYAVQDIKANVYNRPFFMTNHVEAMRAFQQNCENPETLWHKYPEDFRLMHVGAFDDQTGQFSNLQTPGYLCSALDYARKTPIIPIGENGLNEAGKHFSAPKA